LKIETLTNLIGGELLNSPYISEVTSFSDDILNVQRGCCFFAKKSEDIRQAIDKGAYAIISEKYENIIDKEIAWIKVESIQKAVVDIFKYENLKTKIYFCDEITAHIIDKSSLNKEVIILKTYEDLLKSLNFEYKFLITSNKDYCLLCPKVQTLDSKNIDLKKLSLFKSEYLNEEINLPFVYKEEFAKAIKFFEDNDLKYSLDFMLDRFKPVFVDALFREVGYGESSKVLITGIKNDEYFFNELNYLIENTKHAKTIIVNEYNKELLKNDFHFAMLVDFEIETKNLQNRSLF